MPDTGYIRDELDLKFLLLYVLSNVAEPVAFDDLMDMARIDENSGYMEYADAYYGLIDSGHAEMAENKAVISKKGRDALKIYDNRLPSSVRRKAQQSILKTVARIKREACIMCETAEKDKHLVTSLRLCDGEDELMRLDMLVVNMPQAAALEGNFRANAERIYNAVLDALLKDYGAEDNTPKVFKEE